MAVTIKRQEEAPGKIGGAHVQKREVKQLYVVPPKNADGSQPEGEWHLAHNAADLVNIRGWTYGADPRKAAKPPVENKVEKTTEPEPEPDAEPMVATVTTKAPDPVVMEFEALRAKARELNIEFDNRWGRAKLEKAIADATGN